MGDPRILVVGAGPAGLAVARSLVPHASVRIVERRAAMAAAGVGIFIPGNGVRMLDELGLVDAARAVGVEIVAQEIRDVSGRMIGRADLSTIWCDGWPCLAMPRIELLSLLAAGIGVPIEYGREVVGIASAGDTVQVAFGDESHAEFDLVVAADGVWSTLRQALWPEVRPTYSGESYWRALVRPRPSWVQHWTGFLGEDRFFGTLPIGPDAMYCFALALQDAPTDLPAEVGALRRFFAGFPDLVDAVISDLDPATLTFQHAWSVSVPANVVGRCVLVGDAAHANSPSMAQGAALAFEDGVVLGRALAHGTSGLAWYDDARHPRLQHVADTTRLRTEALRLAEPVRTGLLGELHAITAGSFALLREDPLAALPEPQPKASVTDRALS